MSIKRNKKGRFIKGNKFTPEIIEKMSNAKIGSANHIIPHSEETKDKIRQSRIGKNIGIKNYMWKGGISKIDKLCRGLTEYKQWRSDVFTRDNWICRTCGVTNCYITAHHIKSFSKIIKENNIIDISQARECKELWNISNGVTLCEECHALTDNYRGKHLGKDKL